MLARLSIITGAVVFSTALVVSETVHSDRDEFRSLPQSQEPKFAPITRAPGAGVEASQTAFLYTVARQYDSDAWLKGGERFPAGATIFIADANRRRPFVPGFAATADPAVSFDGTEVVFAGRQRAGDRWQIWTVPASGGQAHQLTQCADDCVRPLYLQPDAIVYARKVSGNFVIEGGPLKPGDQQPLQLTYGTGSSLPSDVLLDGRVLFEAALPADGDVKSELYTVYSDGSGVESYRCDHGASRSAGTQLPSGDVVFAREGELARFTSAVAHDVPVSAPEGTYAGGVATNKDGSWLVSWRGRGHSSFELRTWKPGAAVLLPRIAEPGADVIEPVLVRPHPVPNRHPSALHDWSYGNVLCLNAYTSKHRFADGSIASVRLYTRAADGAARLLGTAPVEKDGSFYVRVPGDQPLRLELVDASGRALHAEAGWFWTRRGEQRICVGCHAGPETAPENAMPLILLRSTVPADMTRGNNAAPTGGP